MVEEDKDQLDTMEHVGGGIAGGPTRTVGGGRVSSGQGVKGRETEDQL